MKRKRKGLTALVCLVLVFGLVGCASGQAHIIVHENGSADANLTFSLQQQVKAYIGNFNPFTTLEDELHRNGFAIQSFDHQSEFGFYATKHLETIGIEPNQSGVAHAASPATIGKNEFITFHTDQDDKYFYTVYYISGKLNISSYYNYLLQSVDKQFKVAQYAPSFVASQIKQNLDLRVKVSLPVKAIATNANNVSFDGKDLEWQIDPTMENTVTMAITVPNMKHILMAAGIILLLLIAFIVWRKSRKRSATRSS